MGKTNTEHKTLGLNALLNITRVAGTIVLPAIITPYVSRKLGAENMGIINFSNSIVTYFYLVASLGISAFAIRDGVKYRNSRNAIGTFSSKILRLNLVSMIISYLFLLLVITFVPALTDYGKVMLFQAMGILFSTIGVEWLYTIFEDYLYVTLRTVIMQLVSLILILRFIKSENDMYIYLLINMGSMFIISILNMIRTKKYCNLNIFKVKIDKKSLRIIFNIFFSTLASTIYTNIDITMLGFMKGNYAVGIYSMAVKICAIIKQLIFAGIEVSMPRLSLYREKEPEQYMRTVNRLVEILLILIIPFLVGILIERKELIFILFGPQYAEAEKALFILIFAVMAATAAYFVMHVILLPCGMEYRLLRATVSGAISNLLLNCALIPTYGVRGAAIATAISESIVFAVAFWGLKELVRIKISRCLIGSILVSTIIVIVYLLYLKKWINNSWGEIFIGGIGSITIYFILLRLILKKSNCIRK